MSKVRVAVGVVGISLALLGAVPAAQAQTTSEESKKSEKAEESETAKESEESANAEESKESEESANAEESKESEESANAEESTESEEAASAEESKESEAETSSGEETTASDDEAEPAESGDDEMEEEAADEDEMADAEEEDDDADEEADEEDEDGGAGMVAVHAGDEDDDVEGSVVIEMNDEDNDMPAWEIGIGGYVRTNFSSIENDPDVDFVGRNDGFQLFNARLSFNGEMDNGLGFVFEFDGAVDEESDVNSAVVDVGMRLKDTFIYYQPFDQLRITAGQFKPPYDVEELTSNADLLFIRESVGSAGVSGVAGFNVEGLSLSREVGLRVDGEPWFFLGDEEMGLGVSYSAAVTNGQEANQSFNDNDKLAYYGRGALHVGEYVELGGAYYKNDETRGERPDLVGVDTSAWTADVMVDVEGVTAIGSIMQKKELPFDGQEDEGETTAMAYQGQIAYEEPFLGLQPAYRFAYYDPSADFTGPSGGGGFESDALTYHTIGLNYNAQDYPLRLMVNYTITGEQEQRKLKNNRLDALVQLSW